MQGLPSICLAGRRMAPHVCCMLQEGVKKGLQRSWTKLPPAAALSARPERPILPSPSPQLRALAVERRECQEEAAAAVLHLGTSARGTLAGAIPVDAAKLEPGRRVRIS